ncbi:MAG: hypothetical protein OHK0046_43800 [Anaerolineae bacterium]
MRRIVLLLMMIGLLGSAALAQVTNVPVDVQQAEILTQPDGSYVLNITQASIGGCDVPVNIETTTEGDTLRVSLFQPIPVAMTCPFILRSYTEQFPLNIPEGITTIQVNDFTLAFDPEAVGNALNGPVIEAISLLRPDAANGEGWQLRVSGTHPAECDDFETHQTFENGVLLLEITSPEACAGESIPYEALFPVDADPAAEASPITSLRVNGFLGVLPENIDAEQAEIPFEEAERSPILVETVTVDATTDSVTFELTGQYGSGCTLPTHIEQRVEEDNHIVIELYDVKLLAVEVCPAILRFLELSVTLDETLEPGIYTYEINEQEGEFTVGETDDQPTESVMRILHTISTVEAQVMESMPPQVTLVVEGFIPDGCEVPAQIDIVYDETEVFVEIYRELPIDALCTMVARSFSETIALGSFDVGRTYTFHVNDTQIEVTL